jgi:TonB-linked SusC/RagA family outer membrane protein
MKNILRNILFLVLTAASAASLFAKDDLRNVVDVPVSAGIPVAGPQQQGVVVSGRVVSVESSGGKESLPGVSISVKGTTLGVVTDGSGTYTLTVPSTESVLIFSFIGYTTEEVTVGNKSVIDIVMTPDIIALGEIVVVGYGEQKKITTTGAISSVSGEDLVRAPVAGVSNALIGLSPGIQAIQQNGEFGSDRADIRIRGIATLNGAGGGAAPLILVDGVPRETFNSIDLNEIETINILKDASATAVFGVRGANGVILITTKQGKPGKPKVSFSSNIAMLQPIILPQYVNAYDYAILHNEADRNSGVTPRFSDEDIRLYQTGEDPIFHPRKNWIDEIIKPVSFQQSYNVNVSGGTEKMRYFTSLGYFNQRGGYNEPDQSFGFPFRHTYDRYNLRMNFDFDVTDDLLVSVKLGSQISNNSAPNGGAYSVLDRASQSSPMSSPGFIDGKYISEVKGMPSGVPHFNAWAQGGSSSLGGAWVSNTFTNTLNTNVALKYKLDRITHGLSVRVMGAYDSYYAKDAIRYKYFPTYTAIRDPADPSQAVIYQNSDTGPYYGVSEVINDDDKWRKMYGEAAIDYAHTFNSVHTFTGLVLANIQRAYYPNMQYKLPTAYLGLVGRITYDYKNKYLSEFNMGYNGSENFPESNRFGFFPSFSLGWVATEESFIPENKWLTFLKFRGSYGQVGNDKIGGDRYLYLDGPFALGNGSYQAAVFGQAGLNMARYNMYKEGRLGNPEVTWERATKWNAGVEMKFFDNRFFVTADYFEEKRDNILWTFSTSPELVAYPLPNANIGIVENKGYEIETGFNDEIGEVQYWVKGTYSVARNEIVFQDEEPRAYEWMRRTGNPVNQYFGLTFEGFYNSWEEINDPARPVSQWEGTGLQPGDMKYKDRNGDSRITTDDMGPIGYADWPQVTYSFAAGASWKGFDFSVLFQGSDRVSVQFASKAAYAFTNDWGPAHEWNLERWTPERYANREKITYPRLELNPGVQHNYQASDFWVQDGSYLRLKNAEIGYRFSPSFLTRLGIGSMRVYASSNNVFTWTTMKYRMDPDARELWGRVLPPNRVFNAGLNFQF